MGERERKGETMSGERDKLIGEREREEDKWKEGEGEQRERGG